MSILIKNVQVVDGSGRKPYKADVFVDKNIISGIGDLKDKDADETIDGFGNYLTPGFIDVDTASDHYLGIVTYPEQTDFINQGVTTIIGGHCGSSLAPLLYGTLESIRKWVDINQVNVDWHTLQEFLGTLEKLDLGVNFGTMIGHSTVRRSIVGDEERELTQKELEVFKRILSKALEEGGFGLSSGLGYAHGRHVSGEELKVLASVVKNFDAVYSTHLRDETKDLIDSVDETIDLAKSSLVRVLISHMRPIIGFESKFDEAVDLIKKNADAADVHFYVYPFDTSLNALYTLMPSWAQEKNLETMLSNLRNPDMASKIERDMPDFRPDDIKIVDAPKNEYLVGKTISQISENLGLSNRASLLKIMDITGLKAIVSNRNINLERLTKFLSEERVFIASNGDSRRPSSSFIKHDRSWNTFPRYLELVIKNNQVSIEEAIKKITSAPADFFGIKKRGIIKEGFVADIVLLTKDYKVDKVVVGGKKTNGGETMRHSK